MEDALSVVGLTNVGLSGTVVVSALWSTDGAGTVGDDTTVV
jgi:hypothetical protein